MPNGRENAYLRRRSGSVLRVVDWIANRLWGDVFSPRGDDNWMANIWQGAWPYENTGDDGYVGTAR